MFLNIWFFGRFFAANRLFDMSTKEISSRDLDYYRVAQYCSQCLSKFYLDYDAIISILYLTTLDNLSLNQVHFVCHREANCDD